MKFTQSDFPFLEDPEYAAECANERLQQMLSECPIIYGGRLGGCFLNCDPACAWSIEPLPQLNTHKARLIDIQKLGEDK